MPAARVQYTTGGRAKAAGSCRVALEPLREPAMSASSRGQLLDPCWQGMRSNLRPALVLQAFALLVVCGYFWSEQVKAALDVVGELKVRYGYAYSALATCLFGGVVPYAVLSFAGRIPPQRRGAALAFYVLLWLWKGVEVDAFYRAQAAWFGEGAGASTIAVKAFVDQFVYVPLWAAPSQVLLFTWKDAGFSLAGTRAAFQRQTLTQRVLVVTFSTWVVWLPAVAIIYSLPSLLQVPLFNLVLCFWCLLMSFISSQAHDRRPAAA